MGLFDFFKRRAKQDESEKTAEKQSETETKQAVEKTAKPDEPDSQAPETSVKSDQAEVGTENKTEIVSEDEEVSDQVDTSVTSSSEDSEQAVSEAIKPDETEPNDQQNAQVVESDKTSEEPVPETQQAESKSVDATENQSQPVSDQDEQTGTTKTGDQTEPTEAERYDKGLEKSRLTFGQRLNHLLANFRSVDESFFDDLEETLIGADVGFDMAMKISDELREEVKLKNVKKPKDVQNVVVEKLIELYDQAGTEEKNGLTFAKEGPTVILFVGVNGVGKTTTIGKMANLFKQQGKKVLLAAADTFRAGAIEQLNVWAQRDGVDIVKKPEQSDPSAVVYDALKKAKSENYDVLFVDTAGRLQNKTNLMNELAKMKRIITREIPDAPHEVLLVLDATTGQNALNQAKMFKEATDVTGIVLTKLDGTARGGIVLAIRNELHLPVKYVGLGEQVDDLRPFEPSEFVYGLFKGLIDVK
ncbi:cell division protein FtsY [Secundilactobacillus silagincola]|uniref:Signal recognition particle receptor FtsY n=1 Tax=Secundilactobacillus silagincola TaxID=1714681 RepID=A0A1Z5J225_9LACO|nr:signal recognition particle-docking protein FtsY [Secundilactobacillus silagincola]GAX07828.1 cell division protein FtsY [Secundilactobacillus silagincola]